MDPSVRSRLQAAYTATDYCVAGPAGDFAIRIAEPCPELDALLESDSMEWAYVSPCNPGSECWTVDANGVRLEHMLADLSVSGRRFFPGEAVAREGDWPAEPSFLILGIPLADALALARRYGQLAIVAGCRGKLPELFWTELPG